MAKENNAEKKTKKGTNSTPVAKSTAVRGVDDEALLVLTTHFVLVTSFFLSWNASSVTRS